MSLLENYQTPADFAKGLGVPLGTVRSLRSRGMPYLRVAGRTKINVRAATAWIDQHCTLSEGGVRTDPMKGREENFGNRQGGREGRQKP